MAVIDIIMHFNGSFSLTEVAVINRSISLLDRWDKDASLGQTPEVLFGAPLQDHEGILELNSHFFCFQLESSADGHVLYLSRSGVLLDLFEQALDRVTEGIQIYDRNGFFIYGNKASEALEQYDNDAFRGRHILDLYELKEDFSTILTVLRTKKTVLNRCDRFQVKQGKSLTTINSGYPLDNKGTLRGAVVFESDLSVLEQVRKRLSHLEHYAANQRPAQAKTLFSFEDIVHQSEIMKEIIHFSKKTAFTDSNILISGETGTGKELIAQSIHAFSPRHNKPFIDVNCSAVPSNLIESLFFGTEKGAFTGSVSMKGYFELADGGTLFLDEVNSIPIDVQAKLLRALQDKRVQRVGGTKHHQCDVRIISATNEDLSALMQQNKIRRDFYYRLATVKIELPGLDQRSEDIPLLAAFFLTHFSEKYRTHPMAFTDEALKILCSSPWPGNVRELQHAVEFAFNRAPDNALHIDASDLPEYLKSGGGSSHRKDSQPSIPSGDTAAVGPLSLQMNAFEKQLIQRAVAFHDGNITNAANTLGMSRQNLQYHIKKHGLKE